MRPIKVHIQAVVTQTWQSWISFSLQLTTGLTWGFLQVGAFASLPVCLHRGSWLLSGVLVVVFFFFGIKERADQELPRGFWPGEVWSLLIASSRCPSPLHHLLNMPHSLYLFYVVLIFLGKNTLNHIAIHLMPPIPLFHFPHSPTDSRGLNKQHATLVIIPSKSTAGKYWIYKQTFAVNCEDFESITSVTKGLVINQPLRKSVKTENQIPNKTLSWRWSM